MLCRPFLFLSTLCLLLAGRSNGATWLPYGPDGGDARSFAVDPSNHAHLYLGTASGWLYETTDSGAQWKRLARVGKRDDLVLDTILVDAANPKHVMVGAWVLDRADGGIYQSDDGGSTWTGTPDMAGQSIRSLASAPSDPKMIVAGTLTGIYRSTDAGHHWTLISPAGSSEIHEVESLAFDPLDAQTIYAGTWHLPWKTTDGGVTWAPIKQGVIDDSDVFSIIVDPKDPRIVFASACSGIYKSEDKGGKFKKIQGIPSTARRTRVLMQDPQHQNVVFAGTTEGLWRTEDAGTNWSRTTGPEIIVNDVFIDPSDSHKVLLATDRGGVLTSEDGGSSFVSTNRGFSARQITAFVADAKRPGTVYAGVVNDKAWGGIFASADGGLSWTQQSQGLGGRDIFSLGQAPDGTLLAGTSHGIFRLTDQLWTRASDEGTGGNGSEAQVAGRGTKPVASSRKTRQVMVNGRMQTETATRREAPQTASAKAAARKTAAKASAAEKGAKAEALPFDGTVHAFAAAGESVFAGTSQGVMASDASGMAWHKVPSVPEEEWRFLAANGQTVVAASLGAMMVSTNAGATWAQVTLPPDVIQLSAVAVDARGELWAGAREGVYLSSDKGMSWQTLRNLYVREVDSLYFDARTDQVLVTSNGASTLVFAVEVPTRKVTFWDAGWTLRFVRPVGDHLLGATLFDGFVVQPQMVEAKGSGGS